MNLIMQQVLLKLLRAYWNIVDVLNNKFDEILSVLQELFNHLKAQAPTVEAYNTLTLQLKTSFQKVFDKISDLKESLVLAPAASSTVARGGKGSS